MHSFISDPNEEIHLHKKKTLQLHDGTVVQKSQITHEQITQNWEAAFKERNEAYKRVFESEVRLLEIMGVEAYKDEYQSSEGKYKEKYGDNWEDVLDKTCQWHAVRQTNHSSWNVGQVWDRVKTFVEMKARPTKESNSIQIGLFCPLAWKGKGA